MNLIYVADIESDTYEGIYKKIYNQSIALSEIYGSIGLVCKKRNTIILQKFKDRELISNEIIATVTNYNLLSMNSKLFEMATNVAESNNVNIFYIRHTMLPNFSNLIFVFKNQKSKIYYEIPTYPYFYEQLKESKFNFKSIVKIFLELIKLPIIYIFIEKLLIIQSNSEKKIYKKMVPVNNGIDSQKIAVYQKKIQKQTYDIIGLGTIYSYHGYDRIINTLISNRIISGKKIQFHIVGQSQTIEKLKKEVKKLNLEEHVFFYGKKQGKELDEIFNKCDIGMGCLALYRRHADIDTTLKVVDYSVRGIPFVTSGKISSDYGLNIKISNDDSDLDFEKIYEFTEKITQNIINKYANESRKIYNWVNIYKKIFKKEENQDEGRIDK